MQNRLTEDSAVPEEAKPLSNAQRAELRQEWVDELISGCRTEADLFGPDGVFTRLKGAVMSRLLEAEMTHHLGTNGAKPAEAPTRGTVTHARRCTRRPAAWW